MVRPLTKHRSNGELYTRPPAIEVQIDEALKLDLTMLKQRLEITDRQAVGDLRSECLVHLIRESVITDNQNRINLILPVLLRRCEIILRAKIPDSGLFDAESLREEVLSEFSEMLASAGVANFDDLDFFECRFNLAFRALRIDLFNKEMNRLEDIVPLPSLSVGEQGESEEDLLAKISEAMRQPATQEHNVLLLEIWKMITALPNEERQAVVLCYVMEYKVESQNPNEVTAASRCNCSGRTIRNRLARAAKKLRRYKEDS